MRIQCMIQSGMVLVTSTILAAAAQPVPHEVVVERLPDAKPLNVVFVLADDHRYDAMGFMGHPLAVTPAMDRMAREGAHLRNAFVTTSLCSPSRASILTGLHTFRHRVIDNNRPIPAGTLYFPQYLQKAGYATAFIGKWHMGGDDDAPQPGFDHWVSFRGQGEYLAPSPEYTINVDGKRVPQKGYITDELTDYAVDWLGKQQSTGKPFFLYLSHKAVHANFTPAARHLGCLADHAWSPPVSIKPTPETFRKQPRWMRDQRNSWHGVDFPYHSELDIAGYCRSYCETLRAVDDSLTRVMGQLDRMGVADNTLLVYMGDNGFMFGEHGLIDKRVAYEPSIRVPLLMRCPSLIRAGSEIEPMTANIDIAPTIMEAMGLRPPPHMDGRSMLPLLSGKPTPWREELLYVYYWEKNFPQSPTVFALRDARYKYITYYGLWDTDELYDLKADPGELHNLLHEPDHARLAADMEKRLYATMDELGGMEIPLNAPAGNSSNKRLRSRNGAKSADFPESMVVEEPVNQGAK